MSCSSPRCSAIGAIDGINYAQCPNWDDQVLELTSGRGVDHVLEVVGGNNVRRAVAVLARGGHLALIGGLAATTAITDMTARAYITSTSNAITADLFFSGIVKSPFLALAIGLIACGQGLAAQGGAAAVGARTTRAVVLAILGVIVTNALFTLFFTLLGF